MGPCCVEAMGRMQLMCTLMGWYAYGWIDSAMLWFIVYLIWFCMAYLDLMSSGHNIMHWFGWPVCPGLIYLTWFDLVALMDLIWLFISIYYYYLDLLDLIHVRCIMHSIWLDCKMHVAVLAVCMFPGAHVCVCAACIDLAGRVIDGYSTQTGVRAIAAFAPRSAGSGPNTADCLEIRTCFLLHPSHAALCGLWPIARRLWPITNRTLPNSNHTLLIAGAIYPSGIARCCVFVCIWHCGLQLMHMHADGGGSILVVIKPNTIAEKVTTQRHSQESRSYHWHAAADKLTITFTR